MNRTIKPNNPERIRCSQENKMEKTDIYAIEVFNIIEEIEDIFDRTEIQANSERSRIGVGTLQQKCPDLKKKSIGLLSVPANNCLLHDG
jgi:hypothetical protein